MITNIRSANSKSQKLLGNELILFIGGFPSQTTERKLVGYFVLTYQEDLESYFKEVLGISCQITIMKDRKGQKKGFGDLKLTSKRDAEIVLRTEHKIFGKMVGLRIRQICVFLSSLVQCKGDEKQAEFVGG